MTIAPIPNRWKEPVLKVLRTRDPEHILWTKRAERESSCFGMKYQIIDLLITTLSNTIIGQDESSMEGAEESWAFLCQHPYNPATTLYAKLGLIEGRISVRIFSIHTDLEHGKLEERIKNYLKNKRS